MAFQFKSSLVDLMTISVGNHFAISPVVTYCEEGPNEPRKKHRSLTINIRGVLAGPGSAGPNNMHTRPRSVAAVSGAERVSMDNMTT